VAPLSGRDELYPRYKEVMQTGFVLLFGARVLRGVGGLSCKAGRHCACLKDIFLCLDSVEAKT
jgi:hypothetical protein